ncbi:MAG: NfeD family protein [Luteolibacter sp.]
MSLIILLFAIGIVLLAVEVIVPGGILGSIGGVTIFAACVLAFNRFGSTGGLVAVISAAAIGGLAFYVEFRLLPKTSIGRRAFLNHEISAVSSAYGDEVLDLIGKPAVALTLLSPTGYVSIDGKRYEAFSQSGQVAAGSSLKVTAADNFRLIVTAIDSH